MTSALCAKYQNGESAAELFTSVKQIKRLRKIVSKNCCQLSTKIWDFQLPNCSQEHWFILELQKIKWLELVWFIQFKRLIVWLASMESIAAQRRNFQQSKKFSLNWMAATNSKYFLCSFQMWNFSHLVVADLPSLWRCHKIDSNNSWTFHFWTLFISRRSCVFIADWSWQTACNEYHWSRGFSGLWKLKKKKTIHYDSKYTLRVNDIFMCAFFTQ